VAESFIHSYNGNIVFGHGPHTKAGVKVVQRNDGRKGVIFTSLGNFLHPGLAPHYDNYVGRAVFDFETRQLRFVQVYPLGNTGDSVEFMKTSEAKSPISNFTWKTGAQSYYASFE
jgi:poly-gamma-glutamate synthesis protein (capsule biosynthesis protein)